MFLTSTQISFPVFSEIGPDGIVRTTACGKALTLPVFGPPSRVTTKASLNLRSLNLDPRTSLMDSVNKQFRMTGFALNADLICSRTEGFSMHFFEAITRRAR